MVSYSALDKILHRAALGIRPIAEMSFDLDQKSKQSDLEEVREERHVFVSGLARAGTTILMRRIYASGLFRSLTYRDMPFVLAPNLWKKLPRDSRSTSELQERAHGDNILVNADSPESLDEVYWRIFDGEAYISKTHLLPHYPDKEIAERYVSYVAAILASDERNRSRYLSKNNNNILRLPAVREVFPNALLLIPFREPLSHANSLLNQHRNFCKQQKSDRFVRSYMTWLAHHEFGLDHRPFRFSASGAKKLTDLDTSELNYWLELWCQVYEWLESLETNGLTFVAYEDLCADPAAWQRIARLCGLPEDGETGEPFVASKKERKDTVDESRLQRAAAIYSRLLSRSRNDSA